MGDAFSPKRVIGGVGRAGVGGTPLTRARERGCSEAGVKEAASGADTQAVAHAAGAFNR
jgi:hypothetical protein